jgi:transcriptional regulator with XRE-family HTH domain
MRLAGHRERNGLKQSELAERLYYDRTSISKIETGQQPAPEAFWCAADELLDTDGELAGIFGVLTAVKTADSQADRRSEGRPSSRPSDLLGEILAVATLPAARARSRSSFSAQNDIVIELGALSRALAEHTRCVLMGEPADWVAITERLSAATTACRRRGVIEPCVAGYTRRN